MFNNLHLDIDDDIFVFMPTDNNFVDIWEVYKLGPKADLIVKKLGEWKKDVGLSLTKLNKWQRRGDLKVSFSKMKYKRLPV